jgi:hypothetical protein
MGKILGRIIIWFSRRRGEKQQINHEKRERKAKSLSRAGALRRREKQKPFLPGHRGRREKQKLNHEKREKRQRKAKPRGANSG